MKFKPNLTNVSVEVESHELSEKPTVTDLLSEFLHAELKSLKHQIEFSENMISGLEDEISRSENAQLFRADKYRMIEELAPDNIVGLIEVSIGAGVGYESLLQRTYDNFNQVCDALKSAYASFLELSIKVKDM